MDMDKVCNYNIYECSPSRSEPLHGLTGGKNVRSHAEPLNMIRYVWDDLSLTPPRRLESDSDRRMAARVSCKGAITWRCVVTGPSFIKRVRNLRPFSRAIFKLMNERNALLSSHFRSCQTYNLAS